MYVVNTHKYSVPTEYYHWFNKKTEILPKMQFSCLKKGSKKSENFVISKQRYFWWKLGLKKSAQKDFIKLKNHSKIFKNDRKFQKQFRIPLFYGNNRYFLTKMVNFHEIVTILKENGDWQEENKTEGIFRCRRGWRLI